MHGKGASLKESALTCMPAPRKEGTAAWAGCLGPGSRQVGIDLDRRLRDALAPVPPHNDPSPTPMQTAAKLFRRWRPPALRAALAELDGSLKRSILEIWP